MNALQKAMLGLVMTVAPIKLFSQTITSFSSGEGTSQAAAGANFPAQAARYFQLTMVLRYPATAGQMEPGEQSITTEVAVSSSRAGSCKTRMTSQIPIAGRAPATLYAPDGSRFIELGTKLDCNNVHMEGEGLAFSFVLETSRVSGMIVTGAKGPDGVAVEEPIITARKLELSVRLPLDKPKTVFDSNTKGLKMLRPIKEGVPASVKVDDPALQIEMVATELK